MFCPKFPSLYRGNGAATSLLDLAGQLPGLFLVHPGCLDPDRYRQTGPDPRKGYPPPEPRPGFLLSAPDPGLS